MTHDIAHCDKQECLKKDSCYRFQAHLEAREKKMTFLSYFFKDQLVLDEEGKCKYYIRTDGRQ